MRTTLMLKTRRRQKKKQEGAPSTLTKMISLLAMLLLTTGSLATNCADYTPDVIGLDIYDLSSAELQIAWGEASTTTFDLAAYPMVVQAMDYSVDYVNYIPVACLELEWWLVNRSLSLSNAFLPCVYFDNDYAPTKLLVDPVLAGQDSIAF